MKVNNIETSTNFKWNRTTHLEMSMLAMENLNIDKISKRQIARYSQMPDYCKEELGFYNNTHFFFPYSKNKSFGKDPNKLNALEKFKQHLIKTLKSNNKDDFLKSLGYALHYLQDVSVPLHTESGNIAQKILKYQTHTEFEKGQLFGAKKNTPQLVKNYEYEEIQNPSFINLFIETAQFSQKPKYKVTRFNKKNWYEIQQDCFSRGVNVSRAFINNIFKIKNYFWQNL